MIKINIFDKIFLFFFLSLLFLFLFFHIFIFSSLLGIIIIIIICIFWLTFFIGAPYVPSFYKNKEIFKLAKPKKGEVLYDLGSGSGKLIIETAKKFDIKAVGIEINPLLVLFSRWKVKKMGLENKVEIRWKNIFTADIKQADIVFCYLLQTTNNFLEKKLLSQLKEGTKVISYTFTFKKIPLIKNEKGLRLYKIPYKK